MNAKITFTKLAAEQYRHADPKATAHRYAVLLDGVKIGEVFDRSEESYASDRTTSPYRWGFRGYARYWSAERGGRSVSRHSRTRADAVADLVAAHQAS